VRSSVAQSSGINLMAPTSVFDISAATDGASIRSLQGREGTVKLGAETLTITEANPATVFAGRIEGGGELSLTGGTLILNGTSGAFTGSTEVAEGTLIVGSETDMNAVLGGNVTVESDATLGGYGTFGSNVNVKSGGIVAPGHSIGTLTVGGDLTVAKGGVLDF